MPIKIFGNIRENVKYKKRISVRSIIEHNGKIFLNKNIQGNFYELPGGGKEKETLREAVIREVKEETGLDVVLLKRLAVANEILEIKDKNKFSVVYCYVCRNGNKSKIKPEKGLRLVLVTPKEAINLIKNSKISNPLAKYAKARDIYFVNQFLKTYKQK